MRRILIVVALGGAGCLPSSEFRCDDSADCGAGGRCESVGYCSFADSTCGSMQRFSDGAGPHAGECVGAVDPPVNCPAGYGPIMNGTPGHYYRSIAKGDWTEQVAACASPETYLAIPNDLTELNGIAKLNGSNKVWLGISDQATEGMFVDVRGMTATFLPWKAGSPDSGDNDKDCVAADSPSKIIDDACDAEYEAACECE